MTANLGVLGRHKLFLFAENLRYRTMLKTAQHIRAKAVRPAGCLRRYPHTLITRISAHSLDPPRAY